jgi:CBS domain-containing protein
VPAPPTLSTKEVDQTLIKDIMTPVVYSVLPEVPVTEVINQMLGHKVHRLFVVTPAAPTLVAQTEGVWGRRMDRSMEPSQEILWTSRRVDINEATNALND